MEKKFNLHDLFGVLFPGALLSAAVYVFLNRLGWVEPKLTLSETLVLLPVAYIAGEFVHLVASWLLHEREIALQILEEDDSTFTPAFKRELKRAFEEQFGLPSDTPLARQAMFDGCYDYVVQRGKGNYIENHYAKYSLCRSMVLVVPFVAILAFVDLARTWDQARDPTKLVQMMAVYIGAVAVTRVFHRGTQKFIKRFATGVYRTFYAIRRDATAPVGVEIDPEGIW